MVNEQYFIDNLDKAIENEWIKAYHQPLIRAANGHVCDEEAFARWEDPQNGIFKPDDFLPVLERANLTYKLDLYMAERVLKKLKMQGEGGLHIIPESINLARSDFYQCDMVKEIAKRNGIKPRTIRQRMTALYWNIYEAAEIPLAVYKK